MVMIGFFIASFSFYFSFYLLFKGNTFRNSTGSDTKLKIAAIVGALFFAYNPWSFERIPHWYLWIGYTILPLFFVSIVYAFRNPTNLKYIASSIFLWSIASTTPHMTVFYGLIFGTVFAAFVLNIIFTRIRIIRKVDTRSKKDSNRTSTFLLLLIPFLSIIFLYALINAYWIYPVILASQLRSISPNYLMVEGTLEFLSRESNFLNTFRLVSNWQEQPFDIPVEGTFFYYVWYFASLALPIFGFSALIISRKFAQYTSIFSIFAIIGIILAMGTQSPINYFKYVLGNPILSDYGWLVRDPDKWGFLIAFTYSFLIGVSSYKILERVGERSRGLLADKTGRQETIPTKQINKKKDFVRVFFLCLIITSIGLYSYPVYVFNMLGELRPVTFPAEFENLNSYLTGVDAFNVYFLPYPLDETKWNKMNRVGNIYQTHSLKPSIESSGSTGMAGMSSTNYYNYLAKAVVENRSQDIRNFIYPLGSTYLIFHNDTWDKRNNSPNKENLEILEGINSLEGLGNVRNIGFYNIFKVDDSDNNYKNTSEEKPQQVSILNNSIVALGGLDALQSLNSLQPSFSSLDSSVFFVDQAEATDVVEDVLVNSNYLILEKSPSYYDLLLSIVDNKYIIEPSKVPVDYDPMGTWSKTGAMDPDNGVFHPYLENLGIDNWQFDYGKGLAITQAAGVNLSIPVNIDQTGQFEMFLRFLKNQEGGMINIYLDDILLNQINSLDERSNYFVWQQIVGEGSSPLNLKQGRHKLTIENVAGFNAINMFGIIPVGQIANLQEKVSFIANKTTNVHLLEAESSFYNNKGRSINGNDDHSYSSPYIYYLIGADDVINNNDTAFTNEENVSLVNFKPNSKFSGQVKVPENANLLTLKFLTKHQNGYYNGSHAAAVNLSSPNMGSDYFIESLEIYPAKERQGIITSDFERGRPSISLAELRKPIWINHDTNTLATNIDNNNPISGNESLKVDVRQGNESEWSTITTDQLPIHDKSYYTFSLNVSAKDVNQLHSRISYYDKEREKIGGDYISRGRDGTYHDIYSASIVPPLGAKYLRFEILIKPSTTDHTSYIIDDMRFEEIGPQIVSFDGRVNGFEKLNTNSFETSSVYLPIGTNNISGFVSDDSSGKVNNLLTQGLPVKNSTGGSKINHSTSSAKPLGAYANTYDNVNNIDTGIMIQQTKPIPVLENGIYNFSISLNGKQIEPASSSTAKSENVSSSDEPAPAAAVAAYFTNSNDVIENSTKYGQNASGGSVLTLSPGSQIYTDLDILKPANYTIALKANRCESCDFLTVVIEDEDNKNIIRTETISLRGPGNNNSSNGFSDQSNSYVNNTVKKANNYNSTELKWLYLNSGIYLGQGKYQIRIYSNSNSIIDLDSVAVYSNRNNASSSLVPVASNGSETLDKIFDLDTESPPAYLEEYTKINPTKYEVKIENATRPYMMSLIETYDPLWMASYEIDNTGTEKKENDNNTDPTVVSNGVKIPSIPLYSIINGFYINKTGDYTLTLEYQPQKWFTQVAPISIAIAIAVLILLFIPRIRSLARYVKTKYSRTRDIENKYQT
jgi:hypothetical protein